MTDYSEIEGSVFRKATVWTDEEAELRWYRWAWPCVASLAEREGALSVAVTLAYVYMELCRLVCGENFYEDLWDILDEYGIGDREEAQARVTALHPSVSRSLLGSGAVALLTAFHASYAKPSRADGCGGLDEMVTDDESFRRYVEDEAFRDDDERFAALSDYAEAKEWLEDGAEMILARQTMV